MYSDRLKKGKGTILDDYSAMGVLNTTQKEKLGLSAGEWLKSITEMVIEKHPLITDAIRCMDINIISWRVAGKDAELTIGLFGKKDENTYQVVLRMKDSGQFYFEGLDAVAELYSSYFVDVVGEDGAIYVKKRVLLQLEVKTQMMIQEYERMLKQFRVNFSRELDRRREKLRRIDLELKKAKGIKEKIIPEKGALKKSTDRTIESVGRGGIEVKVDNTELQGAYDIVKNAAEEFLIIFPSACNDWAFVSSDIMSYTAEHKEIFDTVCLVLKVSGIVLTGVASVVLEDILWLLVIDKLGVGVLAGYILGKAIAINNLPGTFSSLVEMVKDVKKEFDDYNNHDGFIPKGQ